LTHSEELNGQLWNLGEYASEEDRAVSDFATGITNVGFLRAALRRSAWLWCATAAIGLLAGLAGFKKFPPAYQASTTILLSSSLPGAPGEAVQDDMAIAESRTVAGAALRSLGLAQSPTVFVGDYSTADLSDRVFAITVKSRSQGLAIREANALAKAFLAFQAQEVQSSQRLATASLQHQAAQITQHIQTFDREISQASGPTATTAQHSRLSALETERSQETTALRALNQSIVGNESSGPLANAALVKGSEVLDPAVLLPKHTKRYLLLYGGGGLIVGLALGVGVVLILALVSDKLWRRDEVAQALGAAVNLSVAKVQMNRHARSDVQAAAKHPAVRMITAHLDARLPWRSSGTCALGIVPIGDQEVAAWSVVSLALMHAEQGARVLLADLCERLPAARLLDVTEPGVHPANVRDARLLVAVPGPEDPTPGGPLAGRAVAGQRLVYPDAEFAAKLSAASGSADIVLTLASLDPSVGGEYLAGWAHAAVVVVTAGRSSAERVHSVGEMIRMAGVELASAVLVGAAKTDASLGVPKPTSRPGSVIIDYTS
jgi:capsular polysaccharide biosynthesis protein